MSFAAVMGAVRRLLARGKTVKPAQAAPAPWTDADAAAYYAMRVAAHTAYVPFSDPSCGNCGHRPECPGKGAARWCAIC